MNGVWHDLRVALRSIARRPAFASAVALTLGLGVGATTAVFSVVDGIMLRPLPYADSDRLVAVGSILPGSEWSDRAAGLQDLAMVSLPNYIDLEARAASFAELAAVEPNRTVLPDNGDGPEIVPYANVSPNLLEMLGARAALGRVFVPEDSDDEGADIVLLSHGAWQRRFGGDPGVIGQPAFGGSVVVAGVLAADFNPPKALFQGNAVPEYWFPMPANPSQLGDAYSRERGRLYLLGRLADGVSVDMARREGMRIAEQLARDFPTDNLAPDGSVIGIGVNGLHAQTVGSTGRALRLFLIAAVLLLLLAAMNAATLLLSRALDRRRELGVRAALGAGRGRIARLIVCEATVISIGGGIVGAFLAYGAVRLTLLTAPASIPLLEAVTVDTRTLVFAIAVALATGMVVGLLPALRLVGQEAWTRLGQRTVAEPESRLRAWLVGGQLSISVVLLAAAGLLSNSFLRMTSVDPGFEAEGLVTIRVEPKGAPGWNLQAPWLSWDRLLDELRAVPGVEAVAAASRVPFEVNDWAPAVTVAGEPEPSSGRTTATAGYAITPGYLATVGTRLLRGRDIELTDGPDSERVALVNESFVRARLPNTDPVGATLLWYAGSDWAAGDEWTPPEEWLEGEPAPVRISGVVEDVLQTRVTEEGRPAIYLPYTQSPTDTPTAVVRSTRAAEDIVLELRRAAAQFNPRVPPIGIVAAAERMAAMRIGPRFYTLLAGVFAIFATLVAAVGLYAALNQAVGRRRREIGIRMALGAERRAVLQRVLGHGMRLTLAGLVIGIVAAILITRLIDGFLFTVEPHDPLTLVAVSGMLLLVATVACALPAAKATAIDPAAVLGAE